MKKIILVLMIVVGNLSFAEYGLFFLGKSTEKTEGIKEAKKEVPKAITAEERLDNGRYLVETEEYAKGREELTTYLATNNDIDGYKSLITAHIKLKEFNQAKKVANKAIGLYPEDISLEKDKLDILRAQMEVEESAWKKGELKKDYYVIYEEYLIKTDYNDSEAVFELGNEYFMDSYYEKAMKVFIKDKNGDIKNLFGAATTMRFLGKYGKASSYYTRVIDINPNFSEAYVGRGSARQLLGNVSGAVEDFEKYLEYKKDKDVYIAIANMYVSTERYSGAKSVLERARKIYPNSQEVKDLLVEVYSKSKK